VTAPSLPVEPLLEHASALRRVARALVRDAHRADDLVQTTWLRALRARPEDRGAHALPWLIRVLRNEARADARASQRAAARERRAARREDAPATVDVALRLAVQRAVLDAVAALPPAHREVVYLRWFENQPPRRIAQRLCISRRAVESRLRRALELLRARLDAQHRGGREEWLAALGGFLLPSASWSVVVAGVAMQAKILLAVLATGLAALWCFGFFEAAPHPAAAAAASPLPPAAEVTARAPEPLPAEKATRTPVAAPEPDAPAAPAAEMLHGVVLDAETHAVPGVELRFVTAVQGIEAAQDLSCIAAADGTFAMPDPRCNGRVECDQPPWTTVLSAERTYHREPVVVVVAPRRALAGTVVRDDGAPVEGARVALALPPDLRSRFDVSLQHSAAREVAATTDALGRFAFEVAPALEGCAVEARADGLAPAALAIDAGEHRDLRIVLPPLPAAAGTVRGVVLDATGQPVARAKVALGRQPLVTGADGRFEFVVTDARAQDRLFAVANGWRPVTLLRSEQPDDRWPDLVELRLTERPLSIAGTVLDAEGKPHAAASVWVDPTYFAAQDGFAWSAEQAMLPREPLWRRFETDADGRFRIDGLLDREYELHAIEKGTTAVTALPGVRAGSEGVVLRFPPDALLDEVVGRVVDSSGAPVPGISLTVSRPAFVYHAGFGDQTFIDEEMGARAESDADGRFVLKRVPRRGVGLSLYARDLITDHYDFEGDVVTSPCEIVVTRRCALRIDVAGSALAAAEEAALLDGRGEALEFRRESASEVRIEKRTRIEQGRTEVLYVPDTGRTVVLLAKGVEIGRLPVRPDPAKVVVARP
jgi:RNA polymerase sigma-70 factor (ECF subfamily)